MLGNDSRLRVGCLPSALCSPLQNVADIRGKVARRLVDLRDLERLLHDMCSVTQCRSLPVLSLSHSGYV